MSGRSRPRPSTTPPSTTPSTPFSVAFSSRLSARDGTPTTDMSPGGSARSTRSTRSERSSLAPNNDEYEIIGEAHWQILENSQQGTDEIVLKVYGYRNDCTRKVLFHIISILLCSIPYFVVSYYPKYEMLKYTKCSLKSAEIVFVLSSDGSCKKEIVQETEVSLPNFCDKNVRYFLYQLTRYIWLKDSVSFINVQSLNEKATVSQLIESTVGINKKHQNELIKLYGHNGIEVEVKSYWALFVTEVFNPFYLFQVFSIILWSLDEYYHYAACIFILSCGSIISSLYQTKKLSVALHELVESSNCNSVTVQRPGHQECLIEARSLVPGDVLVLPPSGYNMPCDAVLLTGTCIVNESMLTGESVPVVKSPPNMSSERYSTSTHKRNTLFAGTNVIQTRFYGNNKVLAKVVRTGFYTSKGELVKSILFPKSMTFQFYKDAVKFVIFLFFISAIGMGYCIWIYVERGSNLKTIIFRTLDIITVVVAPALPAAMTAGTVYSQSRLKLHNIFCISPLRINVCGKLQLICFDKTGTLTEDGLDLHAVLPHYNESFGDPVYNITTLSAKSSLMQALASCHSLTSIENQLTGDPLDLKMFEATGWILEEPGTETTRYDSLAPTVVKPASTSEASLLREDIDPLTLDIPYEIGLLRRFHFSSTQQSMGVIARVLGQTQMIYFVKGAPEKIAGMCCQSSLPENFTCVLNDYASRGFRVIGLAYKKLDRKMKWIDAQRVKREQLECNMNFLGLLIMQNSLKPQSAPIISDLHNANIRLVMITGDNIMTAVSVSRDCGMVPSDEKIILISHTLPQSNSSDNGARPSIHFEVVGEPRDIHHAQNHSHISLTISSTLVNEKYCFALDGKTWNVVRQYYPDLMPRILTKGTVFGRFGPDQKTQLVLALQQLNYVVGMCGDGANDCGALKAAHIGISLSQAEASVAAPFTSRIQDITCVKYLAMEGRCALSTSFAIFKYMALYSLIQFFSVLILYNKYSVLGNMQFLYIDLIVTTSLALSMGRAGPAKELCARSPPVSLVGPSSTVPLLLQVAACLLTQLAALCILEYQPWFKPVEGGADVEVILCWENTVIFIVSSYQYVILACVYSKGQPFRETFCSNVYMVITLLILSTFTTIVFMSPWEGLSEFFEVVPWDYENFEKNYFRIYLLLVPGIHLLIAIAIEACLADSIWFKSLIRKFVPQSITRNKLSYKTVMKQMEGNLWMESLKPEVAVC